MRRWLIGLFVFVTILLGCVYIFIPKSIHIHCNTLIGVTQGGLFRNLIEKNNWNEWWPEVSSEKTNLGRESYTYKKNSYEITKKTFNTIDVLIKSKSTNGKSTITIIPLKLDTISLNWDILITTSYNPLKRVQLYFKSKEIASDVNSLLHKINHYNSDLKNVYGYKIEKARVVDSFLISTYIKTNTIPSTAQIYELIDDLKAYVKTKSAKETGLPMLNIFTTDSVSFTTRVAIPVDVLLEPKGNITYNKMLGGGNILVAEVKGGMTEINKAIKQMELYISDYNRMSPAMPYQSLITDRREVTDRSKWITKIYYPVM